MIQPRTLLLALTLALVGCASASPRKPETFYRQLINNNAADVAQSIVDTHPVRADSDARTNTVILHGDPRDLAGALADIDRMENLPVEEIITTIFFVMHPRNASAEEIAVHVQAANPDLYHVSNGNRSEDMRYPVVLAAEVLTNSLMVTADASHVKELRALVARFDSTPERR